MQYKKNVKKIIVLLGASNDEKGKLSQMSMDRIECAYSIYSNNGNTTFLCTGGFGEHFNTTDIPHAKYLEQQLLSKGVSYEDFLPFIISSNTKEDILALKNAIDYASTDLLVIITSDFHIKRVKMLYEMMIHYENVVFIPAISTIEEKELQRRTLHEAQAIGLLKRSMM